MVEDVEEFSAELQARVLAKLCNLGQRSVDIVVARPGEQIAAGIAHCSICRSGEDRRAEELRDSLRGGSGRIALATEGSIDIGPHRIARVARAGRVIAKLRREGEAGFERGDGGECPPGDYAADDW